MKNKNKIKAVIIVLVVVVISWAIVNCVQLSEIKILQEDFLFTYLGVFLGFAITIYTFGISILDSIKSSIESTEDEILPPERKKKFFNALLSGFHELKSNILFITYSFLIVVVLVIIKNVKYPDNIQILLKKLDYYCLLETIYLSIFILSILIIFDLLYSMFNLAEIALFIIKKKINKTNT